MKIRIGFVSNSSSASFILDKRYISEEDSNKLKIYLSDKSILYSKDEWNITEDEDFIRGFTIMDNGYLENWIKENLDLPYKAIVSWDCD